MRLRFTSCLFNHLAVSFHTDTWVIQTADTNRSHCVIMWDMCWTDNRVYGVWALIHTTIQQSRYQTAGVTFTAKHTERIQHSDCWEKPDGCWEIYAQSHSSLFWTVQICFSFQLNTVFPNHEHVSVDHNTPDSRKSDLKEQSDTFCHPNKTTWRHSLPDEL